MSAINPEPSRATLVLVIQTALADLAGNAAAGKQIISLHWESVPPVAHARPAIGTKGPGNHLDSAERWVPFNPQNACKLSYFIAYSKLSSSAWHVVCTELFID